ncbi:hypothetical protein Tco_1065863 [Tanacetum coccineum]
MKEQAYNIIKTKDSRTQRQSNLKKFMEARFKISPQKFEDHTLGEIVSLKYVCEHGSSESIGNLASREIVGLKITSDEADEAGPAAEEGAQEIPALAQAPSRPPPAPQPRTMSQRIKRIEEEVHDLRRDVVGLRGVVKSFTTEQSRVSTWLISYMTQLMDASGHAYQAFDSTLVGSSPLSFQMRVRPRIGDASTSATPHTDAQPNP